MFTKNNLIDLQADFQKFEDAARKLQNKNLADVAASAKGKIQQLSEHPDLELVSKDGETPYPQPAPVGDVPPPFVPPQSPPDQF